MAALTAERLLTVWEHGLQRHPIDRALLLLGLAEPATPPEALPDVPLGERNAALMALHCARFGSRLTAWADCPGCGERMEFEIDAAALPPAPEGTAELVEAAGLRFHRPTSRHLAQLTEVQDAEAAARRLLHACAETPEALPQDPQALSRLLDAVETATEAADPWSDLSLAVCCPACGREESAALDIAGILWEEIDAHAQRLLDEVHVLAQAYGWSEAEVLALSDARRAAYLERIQP